MITVGHPNNDTNAASGTRTQTLCSHSYYRFSRPMPYQLGLKQLNISTMATTAAGFEPAFPQNGAFAAKLHGNHSTESSLGDSNPQF